MPLHGNVYRKRGELVNARCEAKALLTGKSYYVQKTIVLLEVIKIGRPVKDLTGMNFNELTVLQFWGIKDKVAYWECVCSCGKEIIVQGSRLISGKTKSCGHLKHRKIKKSLIGQKFGRLTVISQDNNNPKYWYCECDCGSGIIKRVYEHNLLKGATQSCGCLQKEKVRESLLKDLKGKRFGRWVVLDLDEKLTKEKRDTYWICKCDCGTVKSVNGETLKSGVSTSCGCFKKEFTSNLLSLKLKGEKFGWLTVVERSGSFVGEDGVKYSQWLCQCECGNFKIVRGHDLVRGKVTSCGCLNSKGEYETIQKLLQYSFSFKTQYTFDDLKSEKGWKLRFDFAVFNSDDSLNCLIEFQGPQHDPAKAEQYGDFGKQQREITDKQKREYCFAHDIPLYEIWSISEIDKILDIIQNNLK